MEFLIKEVKRAQERLKEDREKFWRENKKNFKKNVKTLIDRMKPPRGWWVYIVVSDFLFDEEVFPFDYDSWSSTNLIAATKAQGHEIMMFFNKARSEFLSLPALVPLIEHELYHARQAAENPKKFLLSILDDKLSMEIESEAEEKVRDIADDFRKEWILESIVYCYDTGGWKFAKKMANFLYKEMINLYGGGYDRGMTAHEYNLFKKAVKKKRIELFIDGLCGNDCGGIN